MEKVWEIKDPESYLRKKPTGPRPVPRVEKDPSKAYNLSMFYWGGGQLYNDQLVKGAVFLVTQALILAGAVLFVIYDDELLRFLRASGASLSSMFLGGEALIFCILLFLSLIHI